MKISEMTTETISTYLRLEYEDLSHQEIMELETMLNAARNYVCKYTALSKEQADEYEDFAIVVYALCQDMYDNRDLYVNEGKGINKLVENILSLHSQNLLAT